MQSVTPFQPQTQLLYKSTILLKRELTGISVSILGANMLITSISSFKPVGNFITKFRVLVCFLGWIAYKAIFPQNIEKASLSMFCYYRKYLKILLCLADKRRSKKGSSCWELNWSYTFKCKRCNATTNSGPPWISLQFIIFTNLYWY